MRLWLTSLATAAQVEHAELEAIASQNAEPPRRSGSPKHPIGRNNTKGFVIHGPSDCPARTETAPRPHRPTQTKAARAYQKAQLTEATEEELLETYAR